MVKVEVLTFDKKVNVGNFRNLNIEENEIIEKTNNTLINLNNFQQQLELNSKIIPELTLEITTQSFLISSENNTLENFLNISSNLNEIGLSDPLMTVETDTEHNFIGSTSSKEKILNESNLMETSTIAEIKSNLSFSSTLKTINQNKNLDKFKENFTSFESVNNFETSSKIGLESENAHLQQISATTLELTNIEKEEILPKTMEKIPLVVNNASQSQKNSELEKNHQVEIEKSMEFTFLTNFPMKNIETTTQTVKNNKSKQQENFLEPENKIGNNICYIYNSAQKIFFFTFS